MPSHRQLILPFAHRPQFADQDFVASPGNHEARAWLGRTASWPQDRLVVSGPAGSGKTHLLHIWARRHHAEIRPAESLEDLATPPAGAALAIDDADRASSETALCHLLNLAAEHGTSVLLTAQRPPASWQIILPDLASRLRGSAHVAIGPADEELLRHLLLRLASDRQLTIPPALADFLLLRLPRTQAALREAVVRLDQASMERGGLNREMVNTVIAEFTASEGRQDVLF